jgi:hypothetical protein
MPLARGEGRAVVLREGVLDDLARIEFAVGAGNVDTAIGMALAASAAPYQWRFMSLMISRPAL